MNNVVIVNKKDGLMVFFNGAPVGCLDLISCSIDSQKVSHKDLYDVTMAFKTNNLKIINEEDFSLEQLTKIIKNERE